MPAWITPIILWLLLFLTLKKALWSILVINYSLIAVTMFQLFRDVDFLQGAPRIDQTVVLAVWGLLVGNHNFYAKDTTNMKDILVITGAYSLGVAALYLAPSLASRRGNVYFELLKVLFLWLPAQLAAWWWDARQRRKVLEE